MDIPTQIAGLSDDARRTVKPHVLAWQRLAPFASASLRIAPGWGWTVEPSWPGAGAPLPPPFRGDGEPMALQREAVRLALDELADEPGDARRETFRAMLAAPADVRDRQLRTAARETYEACEALLTVLESTIERYGLAWFDDAGRPVMLSADGAYAAWLVERFAVLGDAIGEAGQAIRAGALERWRTYQQGAAQLDLCAPAPWLDLWALWLRSPGPGWAEIGAPGVVRAVARWTLRSLARGFADELASATYPAPGLLFELASATAKPSRTEANGWNVSAVDASVLEWIERSGALDAVATQALVRALPDLARHAANRPGQSVTVWTDGDASVRVTMDGAHRTAVDVRGGWGALASAIGASTGGEAQHDLAAAARGLAALPIRWSRTNTRGTTALVLDLVEHRDAGKDGSTGEVGRISFLLPMMLWPGFARKLSNDRVEQDSRRMVPVNPALPPTTNPKLGAGPSRLETEAIVWIRDHVDAIKGQIGAPVPWFDLAERVCLSTAKQLIRRREVLDRLLALWVTEGRWIRTDVDGVALWRPAHGWTGPMSLIESRNKVVGGKGAPKGKAKR